MKNSTLLRLFFISIGLPLTCASSSSSTSSTTPSTPTPSTPTPKLKSKSKPKTTSLLVDTNNTAPVVQLEGAETGVPSVSGEVPVSGIEDTLPEKLKTLIDSGEYDEVIKLVDGMDEDELLKCLCQVVTTLDHFKGLFGYLKKHKMVPSFLAHGKMELVGKVIVETRILGTDSLGYFENMYGAIALSLNGARHKRVVGLFEAVRKTFPEHMFEAFVEGFFVTHPPEKDSMPLKRFLSLYGEKFSKKHPDTFAIVCEKLVKTSGKKRDDPASEKLLIDLVGQPSLLTPVAFARGFLFHGNSRASFIKYGYKEAVEEGLKEEDRWGDRYLWKVMVSTFSGQFPEEYPSTGEARTLALKNFKPTKQDREEEWAEEHAPIFLPKLKAKFRELDEFEFIFLPTVLWNIILEYAETGATWIDV